MQKMEIGSRKKLGRRWANNRRDEKVRLKRIAEVETVNKANALELSRAKQNAQLRNEIKEFLKQSELRLSSRAAEVAKKREERRAAPLARINKANRLDRDSIFQVAVRKRPARFDSNFHSASATKGKISLYSQDGFEVHVRRKPSTGARRLR